MPCAALTRARPLATCADADENGATCTSGMAGADHDVQREEVEGGKMVDELLCTRIYGPANAMSRSVAHQQASALRERRERRHIIQVERVRRAVCGLAGEDRTL